MRIKIIAAALLSLFFILALSSAMKNSGTCDEIAHHIPSGYVILSKGDLKMDTCNPPLLRYIVASPLRLFLKINMPDDKREWRRDDRGSFGRDFFYKYNHEAGKMLLFARIPIILIGVLCGLLLFRWTANLYGEKAGLFALLLYVFSPDILAHSTLATADMAATFFIFLSGYSFWLFLKKASLKRILLAGICLGLAQLSKFSATLLYPIFLLPVILGIGSEEKKQAKIRIFLKYVAVTLISLMTIWAGYGFDTQPILKDSMRTEEKLEIAHKIAGKALPFLKEPDYKRLDYLLLKAPFPLGTHVLGILGVLRHGHEGHGTYFLGKWTSHGSRLYFLVGFLIKTPIPLLIFMITGLFLCVKNHLKESEKLILVIIAFFFIISSFSGVQLGVRYILPIYPFCLIIAARSAQIVKKKIPGIILLLLTAWYILSSVLIWPHYLSYFNEAVGGPKYGYKILRDSNIDWGQDLPALAEYMKKNGIREIALEYFGEGNPDLYGIRYRRLNPSDVDTPKDGVYAISVQYLDHVNWSKNIKPSAYAGYSIFIYDFTKKNLK